MAATIYRNFGTRASPGNACIAGYQFSLNLNPQQTCSPPGGGGTQQSFSRRGSSPRSNPLPFFIPFLKVPSINLPLKNGTPFTYLNLRTLHPFSKPLECTGRTVLGENSITGRDVNQKSMLLSPRNILIKGPFKYLNDRFPYPFIYLSS